MVYGSDAISRPSMGMSNSMRHVLPTSIVVWNMMWTYFLSSSSCSLFLASCGILTSGIDLNNLLVSDSNCKPVLLGIIGNNLVVSPYSLLHLTSWISMHFPASASMAMGEFLGILQKLLLVFRTGTLKLYRVSCSTLCRTLSRIIPSGS